jgi:CheY-like chemotaxis protein
MNNDYPLEGKIILIADDDQINFELLRLILKQTKASIIHLKNGQEVINYHQSKQPIDLILMDIQMPIVNGMEATKILRQSGYTGGIFALTALNTSYESNSFTNVGFDEIIEKPVRREQFLKKISSFITK